MAVALVMVISLLKIVLHLKRIYSGISQIIRYYILISSP